MDVLYPFCNASKIWKQVCAHHLRKESRTVKKLLVALCIVSAGMFGFGCEKKADTPGEVVEDATDDMGDAMEDAGDAVEDAEDEVVQ
jgi:hypothetical protein